MCVCVCSAFDRVRNFEANFFTTQKTPSCIIAKVLKVGPEYPSDESGDGPKREKHNSKNRSDNSISDSQSENSDTRPPTPPKPRGMSKSKYKNLVRKHRKKFPKIKARDITKVVPQQHNIALSIQEEKYIEIPLRKKPRLHGQEVRPRTPPMSRRHTQRTYATLVAEHRKKYPLEPSRVLSSSPQEDIRFSSDNENYSIESLPIQPDLQNISIIPGPSFDKRSSADLRMRRARRRAQDSDSKKKANKARVLRRKLLGPQA